MKKNHFILCLMLVFVFQSQAQRYFEFHFPDNVTTCRGCNGFGEEENFIVKVEDDNTEFIERALSDLEKPDSLKQYFVLGRVKLADDSFNLDWSWEYNSEDFLLMHNNNVYSDTFEGIPSNLEENIDFVLGSRFKGKYNTPLARILRERIITSINSNTYTNNLNVYPNPSNDKFTIDFSGLKNVIRVEIRQLDGKLIKQFNALKESSIITAECKVSGIYFVHIITSDQILSRKLSIAK